MNLKAFYIVVTGNGTWGKGIALKTALTFAKVKKSTLYITYTCVLNSKATEEEVQNICKCFNVTEMGGISIYDKPSDEDSKMVEKLIIGWIVDTSNFKG